jgi:molecular chaperone GrpE
MVKERKKTPADEPVKEEIPPAPATDESAVALAVDVTALQAELAQAQAQASEYLDGWQRARAEFANYKRRVEAERDDIRCRSNEALLLKLLPIVDDFERALEALPPELAENPWINGVTMILNKLKAFLESENVTAVTAVGQAFDPQWHEAMLQEETSDHPDGTVLMELRRGYRLGDRMLRPALVKVASNPAGSSVAPDGQEPADEH